LDHHCTWLNTCVGSANYGRFLTVVGLSIVVHAWGGLLCLSTVFDLTLAGLGIEGAIEPVATGAKITLGLSGMISTLLTCANSSLMMFHLWIISANLTTYDYMLLQRKEEMDRKNKVKVAPAS